MKRGDVVLKTKYPEYINGVKQIQNPMHRLFVRVWYSDWFRFFFILFYFTPLFDKGVADVFNVQHRVTELSALRCGRSIGLTHNENIARSR